jgi:ABC-type sugar transport system ATPase subunit
MLEARGISVNYGTREALREVNLRAVPGELAAIIGANGAGKSSLMRALNGGLTVSRGEVLLNESLCAITPDARSDGASPWSHRKRNCAFP